MSGGPYTSKEELNISLMDNLHLGDLLDRGSRNHGSLSQRRQDLEARPMSQATSLPPSNPTTSRPKKMARSSRGPHSSRRLRHRESTADGPKTNNWADPKTEPHDLVEVEEPRMGREQRQLDLTVQEIIDSLQAMHMHCESNFDIDLMAEIGLEELARLEMETLRRQVHLLTHRLQALESQGTTWHHKETLLFTLLMSLCVVNLWMWMRH
ncbi:fetal and adult testis-expressed transcript protein isoform X2 [Echinops telfairi]|uniref:Fetal and adult testis-expressed transcript protein isoform X2 n=1 Tax=Echinops telfairi TaxID=9371 RepID=A0AC55CMR3_ECHTE|nr:fetal and adult testis-expressed transcript protein isoform X2 [Echinops telfairi]